MESGNGARGAKRIRGALHGWSERRRVRRGRANFQQKIMRDDAASVREAQAASSSHSIGAYAKVPSHHARGACEVSPKWRNEFDSGANARD